MKFARDSARTGGVGDPETTDLDRRAQDVVKRGVVREVDYAKAKIRVGIGNPDDEDDYILTDWLPMNGGRAKGDRDWHPLEVGEKVVLLAEGGELSTATVIPAGTYTEGQDEAAPGDKAGVWRKRFANGAEVSYDRNTGILTLDSKEHGKLVMTPDGIVTERGDQKMTLTSEALVIDAPVIFRKGFSMAGTSRAATIDGDVRVRGTIWSTDGVQSTGPILGNPVGNGGSVPEV